MSASVQRLALATTGVILGSSWDDLERKRA